MESATRVCSELAIYLEVIEIEVLVQDAVPWDWILVNIYLLGNASLVTDSTCCESFDRFVSIQVSTTDLQ